jgi:glutamate dehydrogenase (NAD(P)+)
MSAIGLDEAEDLMMEKPFRFADDLGPAKILHVYEPRLGLKATLVVDNVAMGPAIGGCRMAADVSTEECFRLARAMTLKNAAAGLRHGGGKSVIQGDPKMPRELKEQMVRALACALADVEEYIIGPDMGTDEQCMAWAYDEIGRAVGLPREIGGIPLDELGATAWGMLHATEAALPHCDFDLAGARMVIQGFGAVGMHAARFLAERGAVLVAASDSRGAIRNDKGLDVAKLIEHKRGGAGVATFAEGKAVGGDSIIAVECEIWIPAARPDVIHEGNVDRLRTKLIVQGANIPCTASAERKLHAKGVVCLPDFIANAGGVICAAMEYEHASESAAFDIIAEKIRRNTEEVLRDSKKRSVTPRQAALKLAESRVRRAMQIRRWGIY